MYYPFYPEANMGTQRHIVIGIFETKEQLAAVLNRLENNGYTEDSISVAVTDENRGQHISIEHHTHMAEGAAGGGVIGGVTGAVFAALMSTGAIASGGLNLVVAGPILSAFAGFGAGSAAGGLIGALLGTGIPEHDIEFFKEKLHAGHILIAVETEGPKEARAVHQIFKEENALNTDERWRSGAYAGARV